MTQNLSLSHPFFCFKFQINQIVKFKAKTSYRIQGIFALMRQTKAVFIRWITKAILIMCVFLIIIMILFFIRKTLLRPLSYRLHLE